MSSCQIHLYAHEDKSACTVQIVLACWAGDVMGIIANPCSDADLTNNRVAVVVVPQRISGKREFFIKDRTMVIHEGDIVIISPNILHITTNTETPEHERLIVNIHEKHMAAGNASYMDVLHPLFEKEYLIIRCLLQDRLAIETLSRTIIAEMLEKKPGFFMFVYLW